MNTSQILTSAHCIVYCAFVVAAAVGSKHLFIYFFLYAFTKKKETLIEHRIPAIHFAISSSHKRKVFRAQNKTYHPAGHVPPPLGVCHTHQAHIPLLFSSHVTAKPHPEVSVYE